MQTSQLIESTAGGKILHLTLHKLWFKMILQEKKTEEYRDINKYWLNRLTVRGNQSEFKKFTHVLFKNGYNKAAPSMLFSIKEIDYGQGHTNWGAVSGDWYFVIKLDKCLKFENCEKFNEIDQKPSGINLNSHERKKILIRFNHQSN